MFDSKIPFPAFWDHKWTQTLHKVEAIQCIATRAFHKLLEIFQISQKVAQKLPKNKDFFWSDAKIYILYNKSKISKRFGAILPLN